MEVGKKEELTKEEKGKKVCNILWRFHTKEDVKPMRKTPLASFFFSYLSFSFLQEVSKTNTKERMTKIKQREWRNGCKQNTQQRGKTGT
jgi:hypothetical protein